MQLSGRIVVFCKIAKSKRLKLCNTACVRKALGVLLCRSQADHPAASFEDDKRDGQAENLLRCKQGIHADNAPVQTIGGQQAQRDADVITDEVYEHIIYAPHTHTYFATLPGMWERTISCSSLSKTYSVTGWRLGYVIAPAPIIERAKKVHDFLTVGAAAPLQEAVIPGLKFGQDYYDDLLQKYTHKRDLFCKGLDDLGLVHNIPQGAYYVMLDISAFGYDSDLQFCEDLAAKVGVGAVPGSSFFREPVNHLIRFHFAKKDDTLNEALNRLETLRGKIPEKGTK